MLDEGKADLIGVIVKGEYSGYEKVFSQKEKLILISKEKITKDQPLLILGKACFFGQTLTEYFNHSRKVLNISFIESIFTAISAEIGISLLPELLTKGANCKTLEKKQLTLAVSIRYSEKRAGLEQC